MTVLPNMTVNVTHEELDEVMVLVRDPRYRSGDVSRVAEKLKALAAKNGGDFDYRMALLGRSTALNVVDKQYQATAQTPAKTINFTSTVSR